MLLLLFYNVSGCRFISYRAGSFHIGVLLNFILDLNFFNICHIGVSFNFLLDSHWNVIVDLIIDFHVGLSFNVVIVDFISLCGILNLRCVRFHLSSCESLSCGASIVKLLL